VLVQHCTLPGTFGDHFDLRRCAVLRLDQLDPAALGIGKLAHTCGIERAGLYGVAVVLA